MRYYQHVVFFLIGLCTFSHLQGQDRGSVLELKEGYESWRIDSVLLVFKDETQSIKASEAYTKLGDFSL